MPNPVFSQNGGAWQPNKAHEADSCCLADIGTHRSFSGREKKR